MENVKQKMEELCEAVAAKGGNVIIIGDVKDAGYKTIICQMRGKINTLAMDMARVAHRKDGEHIRGILEGAYMIMNITKEVTEEAAEEEVIDEATEEE